jgi:hypothetical protein
MATDASGRLFIDNPNKPVSDSTIPILTELLAVQTELLNDNQAVLGEIECTINRLAHQPIPTEKEKKHITNQGNFVSDMSVRNDMLREQVERLRQIEAKLRTII